MPETIDFQLASRQIVRHTFESTLAKIQLSIANIAIELDDQFAQIADLPIDHPGKRVSYETIYQFIFKTRRDLTQYLQCGRKKRRKRKDPRKKRVLIPERTGIDQRPAHIADRIEYGHWEGDTAVSRQSANALMVLQERTLGLTILEKLPRCAPNEMATAVINRLKDLPEEMRRSITFDNGQENRGHQRMRDKLNLDTYFCDPYSSRQKGSVEHAVGLTRRFWPKKKTIR